MLEQHVILNLILFYLVYNYASKSLITMTSNKMEQIRQHSVRIVTTATLVLGPLLASVYTTVGGLTTEMALGLTGKGSFRFLKERDQIIPLQRSSN